MIENKTVVITGSNGYLGKAFCKKLSSEGAFIVAADIDNKDVIYSSQHKILECYIDICDEDSIRDVINKAHSQFGKIDALVNCAYPRNSNYGGKLENVSYSSFCENVNLNLGGYFLCSKLFALEFQNKGEGNIINISSVYGLIAPKFEIYDGTDMTMPVEYAAIKSALSHLTRYFAKYYRGSQIRFNTISPGGLKLNQPKIFQDQYKEFTINKGMLDPEDIVGTLIFLISDLSKYINGQDIVIDDGFCL